MDAANRLGPGAETADVSLVYTCGSCAPHRPSPSQANEIFFGGGGYKCFCVDSADWPLKFTHGGDLV